MSLHNTRFLVRDHKIPQTQNLLGVPNPLGDLPISLDAIFPLTPAHDLDTRFRESNAYPHDYRKYHVHNLAINYVIPLDMFIPQILTKRHSMVALTNKCIVIGLHTTIGRVIF